MLPSKLGSSLENLLRSEVFVELDSSEGDGRGTNSSNLVLLRGSSNGLRITFSRTVTGETPRGIGD